MSDEVRRTCFNPRTHTGCDMDRLFYRTNDNVSIHAPTRGATYLQTLLDLMIKVSIHAPTRGATRACSSSFVEAKFQSTHPHGVRRRAETSPMTLRNVSIHAPTRGATQFKRWKFVNGRVSIHAPTRGATRCTSL